MVENDPLLDYDHDKRSILQFTTAQLEKRLRYWRERQNEEMLKRYRLITSI